MLQNRRYNTSMENLYLCMRKRKHFIYAILLRILSIEIAFLKTKVCNLIYYFLKIFLLVSNYLKFTKFVFLIIIISENELKVKNIVFLIGNYTLAFLI